MRIMPPIAIRYFSFCYAFCVFSFGKPIPSFFVETGIMWPLLIAGSFNFISSVTSRRCNYGLNEGEVIKYLQDNYSNRHSVPLEEDAVEVSIEMHVQEVSSLNEITGDFEIDILFSQVWQDPQLNFEHLTSCRNNLTLDRTFLDVIWTPNTCLINSKSSSIHLSPTYNIFVILYKNGMLDSFIYA